MFSSLASVALLLLIFVSVAIKGVEPPLVAGLCGVAAMATGLVSQETAFISVDWNTIFLLVGMMMFVGVAQETGLFQFLAIRASQLARGRPSRLLVMLSLVTAILSAFLDNVTTILLVAPITILIADSLEVNPTVFLVVLVMASNIGGTATLIGDPPNIMVGSAAGLGFNAFAANLGPFIAALIGLFLLGAWLFSRHGLKAGPELSAAVMKLNAHRALTNMRLLRSFLLVFALVLTGFLFHERVGLEPATVALAGAFLLALIGRVPLARVFGKVEWPTIFFFIGLFIVVAAVKEQGVFMRMSSTVLRLTDAGPVQTCMAILWLSAFASAFAGAVPVTAALIPFVANLDGVFPGSGPVLWWALALGVCLGGNGTITGTAANLVTRSISEQHGRMITYAQFFRYGFPTMLASIVFASAYLYLRYLIGG